MDEIDCSRCVDWGAVLAGLSTLVGAVSGALLTWARMHKDAELGRSLRPPKPKKEWFKKHPKE